MIKNIINNYLIIILLLLISSILAEDSECIASSPITNNQNNFDCSFCAECSNSSYTRQWFQIDSTTFKCLCCPSDAEYYTKGITSNGEIFCRPLQLFGFPYKKIIYGTKQIITSCQDLGLYEMGDECYHPEIMYLENVEVKHNTKELICKFKYYVETQINGLRYYKCLSYNEDCGIKYKYYDSETRECLNHCPIDKKKITMMTDKYNNIYYVCSKKCDTNDYDKEYSVLKTISEDFQVNYTFCYKECPREAPYYYEDEKICRTRCNRTSGDFIKGKICMEKFSDCTSYREYFVINSKIKYYECKNIDNSNEEFKCPLEYPYLYLSNVYNGKKFCLSQCSDINDKSFFGNVNYYIKDSTQDCEMKCSNDNYYYYFKENGNSFTKSCSENDLGCPAPDAENNDEKLGHYKEDFKCMKLKGNCKIYDNINKNCDFECPPNTLYYEDEGDDILYCLNTNCNLDGKILQKDNNKGKCVENCISGDSENKCDCNSNEYFYFDKTQGFKICLGNEGKCEDQSEYIYIKNDTKECIDFCKGIISLNGKNCYNSTINCNEDNTELNVDKCVCKYKYYYKNISNKKELICLPENRSCQDEGFPYLVEATNECVKFCPFDNYIKIFDNKCLSRCPEYSRDLFNNCECKDKYYKDENGNTICVEECKDDYKLLIIEKNECVKTCRNTDYPVYYNKSCFSIDSTIDGRNRKEIDSESDVNNKAEFTNLFDAFADEFFYCEGVWIEDYNNNIFLCEKNEKNSCSVFKSKFDNKYKYITPTRRCVESCEEPFPYSFKENCYYNCGDNLNLTVDNENLHTCKCKKYWQKINGDEQECIIIEDKYELFNQGYLLVHDTNEVFKGEECKYDKYSLFFNKECYEECPVNTNNRQGFPKYCNCSGEWYINKTREELTEFICLDDNVKKPEEYRNFIVLTKEWVIDDDEKLKNKYHHNRFYYEYGCPRNTTSDKADNFLCVCDPSFGKWYINYTNNDIIPYNICSNYCPENLPVIDKETRQCLEKCKNNISYNGICYDNCPNFTKISSTDNEKCELIKEYESNNISEFTEYIIKEVSTLYNTSFDEDINATINVKNIQGTESSDFVITEFYGVNKDPNKKKDFKDEHNNNKEGLTSSLTYIDLSGCINNIYNDNNMKPTDDIIVLKFDLVNTPNEYLINPVEYKFINSNTGRELDAKSCLNKKIQISYPFEKIIEKYDSISKQKRNLEIKKLDIQSNDLSLLIEKYNIGKELNDLFPDTDTFNYKDNIYYDYCSSIKINGKDLVIEDRINLLLPHYSLCEKNCTYNHTNFKEKRIYCDCDFKTEFDYYRKHEENIELNEFNISSAKQGTTNFPVLKCTSILSDTNAVIKNNYAFYYHIIIIAIEIILLLLSIFFGIKNLKNYFDKKVCNLNNEEDEVEMEIEIDKLSEKRHNKHIHKKIKNYKNKNKLKNEEYIQTSEKNLNYPPKKTIININTGKNEVEFIPEEFIFLYFNVNDKGIRKKADRDLIPFKINKNVKILLEKIEGVDYTDVKASGPFREDQNILEIVDAKDKVSEMKFTEKEIIELNEKEDINNEIIYTRRVNNNYIINNNDEVIIDKAHRNKTFCDKIKIEQRLLRSQFYLVEDKDHSFLNFLLLLLVEILDKIYIIKILFFMQKYDILTLILSIYFLHHVILLNILAMFFDIRTIKKMFNKDYPDNGFYIGLGFCACLIVWILYTIFICIITNKGKYNEILDVKKSKKKNKFQLIDKKYKSLIFKTKIKLIVYSIIQFGLLLFFFFYSVMLCIIYSSIKKKLFLNYLIALIEIVIIKIIYGIILAILRQISLLKKYKTLYKIVLFMDNYII